jgi:protease IV
MLLQKESVEMFRARHWFVACAVFALLVAMPALAGEGKVVAVFELKGPLTEAPDAFGLSALLGDATHLSMYDLTEKLRQARGDDNLRAVVFDIEEARLGMGQIQELRHQFDALRAADKDVLVYCTTLTNGTLTLGSAASKLVMMPTGEVIFNGLYGEGLYFKTLLDKIGCQADILHCGAYKSAGSRSTAPARARKPRSRPTACSIQSSSRWSGRLRRAGSSRPSGSMN